MFEYDDYMDNKMYEQMQQNKIDNIYDKDGKIEILIY